MLSHKPNQDFVSVDGGACSRPVAERPGRRRAKRFSEGVGREPKGPCRGGADGAMTRDAAEAAVAVDGPLSFERSEQDRCQGPGFGAGAVPRGRAEARLPGPLCVEGARRTGAGRGRARPARPIRSADRDRGPVPAGGGRHVLFLPWGRHVPEAGPGRPDHGQRFHPRAFGDRGRGGLRRPRTVLPDLGAGAAARPCRSADPADRTRAGTRPADIFRD